MPYILGIFEVRKGRRTTAVDTQSLRVGRDENSCGVALDPLDRSASRVHFTIDRRDDKYFLMNHSTNGTMVNGELVPKAGRRLYHGDLIEAGNAELTFYVQVGKTGEELFREGVKSEALDPSYAIQCYSLAHRLSPENEKYASKLLCLLEKEKRTEAIVTGGEYFNLDEMIALAHVPSVAAPLARASTRAGDFAGAIDIIRQAGGTNAHPELKTIAEAIERQTDGDLLETSPVVSAEISFFQKGSLRIYVEERPDYCDLRYVDRYHKYLQQHIDSAFDGPAQIDTVFHITMRDQLFAQSLPYQVVILGYYSPGDKRIYIRPRRWLQGRASEEQFYVTLLHEYVHFRVDELTGGVQIPRWFNEGVAQLLSTGDSTEARGCLRSAPRACKSLTAFPDAAFSPAYGDPSTAYLQSLSVLHHLSTKFKETEIVAVLRATKENGGSFARAFKDTLGMSLSTLDAEWQAIQASR
jgi:pSer/pThr/pTyr-binding forkhead associated (FHA) protein